MAQIEDLRVAEIAKKFALLAPAMDERQTRLWLAADASVLGRGGIAAVTAATGVLRKRIRMGVQDLQALVVEPPRKPAQSQRIRRPGAGRKKLTETDDTWVKDLELIIAPETRGDPEPLLHTATATGLKIKASLDTGAYDTERDVSDEEFAAARLKPNRFHGKWNYTIG